MQYHKQLFLHKPLEGLIGDCWRTCIACLFDMHPAEVPHFQAPYWGEPDAANVIRDINEWVKDKGLRYAEFGYNFETVEEALAFSASRFGGTRVLFSGTSKNGTNHIVVARHGEIEWDSAIDNSGIVGPSDNGLFYFSFFVKVF